MDALALPLMAAIIVVLISATTYLTARDFKREKKQAQAEAEAAGLAPPKPIVRRFQKAWWRGLLDLFSRLRPRR